MKHQNKLNTSKLLTNEPIAIVGMSCRFPGIAADIAGYWKVLSEGLQVISDILLERFNTNSFLVFHTEEGGHEFFITC